MDNAKMAQLKTLIRQVVHEELEVIIPDLVTEIKKMVDGRVKVILEETNKSRPVVTESVTPPTSRITKQKIAEMIGVQFDPETDTIRASTRTMNSPMPPTVPTGQPAPAEEVVRAITRDYSDLMAKLNEIRPDVRGVYRT
jgi:hypothetical protein